MLELRERSATNFPRLQSWSTGGTTTIDQFDHTWRSVSWPVTDVTMTKKYLGKAASVSAKFGTPHPPLPASILGGAEVIPLRARSK